MDGMLFSIDCMWLNISPGAPSLPLPPLIPGGPGGPVVPWGPPVPTRPGGPWFPGGPYEAGIHEHNVYTSSNSLHMQYHISTHWGSTWPNFTGGSFCSL